MSDSMYPNQPFIGLDKLRGKGEIQGDFTQTPIRTGSCDIVLFDPPHIPWKPPPSFMRDFGYFGTVDEMRKALYLAWREVARVLTEGGLCHFKWCDTGKELDWALSLRPKSLHIQSILVTTPKGGKPGRDKTRIGKGVYHVTLARWEQTEKP